MQQIAVSSADVLHSTTSTTVHQKNSGINFVHGENSLLALKVISEHQESTGWVLQHLHHQELRDDFVSLGVINPNRSRHHYFLLFSVTTLSRLSALRRSELSASTVSVMVPRSVSRSRRWKSPSTASTLALSAVVMPSSARPLVSGAAVAARRSWLVVPGPCPPPLLPPFAPPLAVSASSWRSKFPDPPLSRSFLAVSINRKPTLKALYALLFFFIFFTKTLE